MSGGTKIKVLVQVEDNEPHCIGEAQVNPTNVQAELEGVFVALVKFLRANPMTLEVAADVMD